MKTLIYECVRCECRSVLPERDGYNCTDCGGILKPIKEVTGSDTAKYNPFYSSDNVNKPTHYADKAIEVIDYIKDTLTPVQYTGYCLGNNN